MNGSLSRFACLALALTLAGPAAAQTPVWIEQGPNGIRNNGNQENITPNSTVSGAVTGIALDPLNANNVVISTVNGGIWRSTDAGASWTPTTNAASFTSMGVGAVAYDVTDSNVLVAGYGRYSSFGGAGGAQAGVLRSTDGGATWAPINGAAGMMRQHQVEGVFAAGSTIVVSTSFSDTNNAYGNIGLYRSTDSGATFTRISGNSTTNAPNGLPGGYTLSMAGKQDAGQSILLTATRFAGTNGIYRSADGGATWALVSASSTGLSSLFTSNNVTDAKFSFGPNGTAYAAIVTGGTVNGIYRSTDNGTTWANTSLDTTLSGQTLNPGGQGGTHFSITAHPTDPNIVFVGGDRTPGSPFGSQTFRINASLAAGSQASRFTNADTSNNSNPHADTRWMAFDALGRVYQGNDGGIYRRDDITTGQGQWISLNPGLRTTEVTGVAYDRITKALITGQQDNGSSVMAAGTTVNTPLASKVWTNVNSGDGGRVAADALAVGSSSLATNASRYSSSQYLGSLRRREYNAGGTLQGTFTPSLTVTGAGGANVYSYDNTAYPNFNGQGTGTIQFLQPIAANQVEGGRLYIGTRRVYESINRGTNLTDLNGDLALSAGFTGGTGTHGLIVNNMEAGGRSGATLQPNVLYVGTQSAGSTNIGGQLFVRPASAAAQTAVTRLTAYSTTAGTVFNESAVKDMAMHTFDWQSVYVVTPKRVWSGSVAADASSSAWTNFTADLTPGGTVFTEETGTFTTIGFVPVAGDPTRGAVLVGTSGGLYYRYTDGSGWFSFIGDDMPNAFFTELVYDAGDDILIASTLGRGVWTLPNASVVFAPVPEPATVLLVGALAAGGLVRLRRKASVEA